MESCKLDTDGDGNCPAHPDGCPKEPYEKPEVTTIDLGNLIDEAEREAASAVEQLRSLRNQLEDALGQMAYLTGEITTVHAAIEAAKRRHLVAQTILELQEGSRGKDEPPEQA